MALNKLDEILAAAQQTISTNEGPGSRGHGGGGKRDRTPGRGFYANEPSYDQPGLGMMSSGSGVSYERPSFLSGHAPQHGMMLRQKSIGVPEEEKQYLHPPAMKFSRSLSVPGPEEIPPPPTTAPPEPPFSSGPPTGWGGGGGGGGAKVQQQPPLSTSSSSAHYQIYPPQGFHYPAGRAGEHPPSSASAGAGAAPPSSSSSSHAHAHGHAHGHAHAPPAGRLPQSASSSSSSRAGGKAGGGDSAAGGGAKQAGLRRGHSHAGAALLGTGAGGSGSGPQQQQQQQPVSRLDRTGPGGPKPGGLAGRRTKGPLVKQSKVEEPGRQGPGKAPLEKSSIPIPTIIVKAPSTSSSGRSSQGSSVEAEPPPVAAAAVAKGGASAPRPAPSAAAPPPPPPAPPPSPLPPLRPQESLDFTSQFGAAIVGAARRDRERFQEARRKSASFFLSAEEEGGGARPAAGPAPAQAPPPAAQAPPPRLRPSKSIDEGMFSGDTFIHHARSMPPAFGLPEYSARREAAAAADSQPRSVPADFYGSTFIHPLTGKVLDPSSPLGLALAARERALKDDGRLRRAGAEHHHFGRQFSAAAASSAPPPPGPASLLPLPSLPSSSSSASSSSSSSSYLVTSPALAAATTPTPGRPPSPRLSRGWEDSGEREGGGGGGGGGGGREGRELRVRFSEDKTVHGPHYQSQAYAHPLRDREPDRERERERERYARKQEAGAPLHAPPHPSSSQPRRPSFLRMESAADAPPPPRPGPAPGHAPGPAPAGGLALMVLPPPAPSVDAEDEFVFADPLPPPLEFANSFDRGPGPPPPPPPPPPLPPPPLPSPQAGDSTTSSLTSYDSEVATLTQAALSPSSSSSSAPHPPPPPPSPSAASLQPSSSAPARPPVSPPPPAALYQHHQHHQQRPFPFPHHLYNDAHALPPQHAPLPPSSPAAPAAPLPQLPLSPAAPQPGFRGPPGAGNATPGAAAASAAAAAATTPNLGAAAITTTTTTTVVTHTATTTAAAASSSSSGVGPERKKPGGGESQETVVDSGIEELDSRSGSDHHLDSILGPSRGGELLDSYMAYLDGQSFEMPNAAAAAAAGPPAPYPKTLQQQQQQQQPRYGREGRPAPGVHRQAGAALPSHPQSVAGGAPSSPYLPRRLPPRARDEEEEEEEDDEEEEEDDDDEEEEEEEGEGGEVNGRDYLGERERGGHAPAGSLGRPASLFYADRTRTPSLQKTGWGDEGIGAEEDGGGGGGGGAFLNGRKQSPSPLASMKASIINELSSKLQQMSGKGVEGWGGQRSLTRHRYSEDSTSALSPPHNRSPSPQPPPHLYPSWGRSPSPQLPQLPQQPSPLPQGQQLHQPQPPPGQHQPPAPQQPSPLPLSPLSPSYPSYPAPSSSPKHRHHPHYPARSKALEFPFLQRERGGSSAERPPGPHRRRAPSPLISPSERPKLSPPTRPSSLPLLPSSAPLYGSLYELRGSVTPPSPANPLGDPYFSPSPPLFAPSGAPPPPSGALVVSRSLSPTHFLSGSSSPPLQAPPPACLSYPHLPPAPPPGKPFASKPLPYWTKFDVADWLAYLNLGEHRERFLDNEIDGTHLPSLTKEDYLDLGVTRVGHRMNIERALKRVMERLSGPFPVSALSPREGRAERRRDEGTRT